MGKGKASEGERRGGGGIKAGTTSAAGEIVSGFAAATDGMTPPVGPVRRGPNLSVRWNVMGLEREEWA
jgi:hypothetical protein